MTRTLKFIISGVFYDHQTSENRKLKRIEQLLIELYYTFENIFTLSSLPQ